jgi:tetratricopeptide (TPR) repeat protein
MFLALSSAVHAETGCVVTWPGDVDYEQCTQPESCGAEQAMNSCNNIIKRGAKADPLLLQRAYLARSFLYEAQGKHDAAEKDRASATAINIKDPYSENAIGAAYYDQKDYQKAIQHFTAAIDMNSKEKAFYTNRANAYQMIGNTALADKDRKSAAGLK